MSLFKVMKPANTALVKKYLAIYRKNPKSRVFALLADLYRKNGERDKALFLCKKGIKEHPQFASGHIALALILMDMNKLEMAADSLEKATECSPENIFAYKQLGQIQLLLKNPQKTLEAYKMVLFLDPENKKAANIIKKLEPITALQYDKTGFAFKSLKEISRHVSIPSTHSDENNSSLPSIHPLPKIDSQKEAAQFESRSSIIEALIYRKEFKKARQFLLEMKNIYTNRQQKSIIQKLENKIPEKEAIQQEQPLSSYTQTQVGSLNNKESSNIPHETITQTNTGELLRKQKKIQKLRQLLARIEHIQSQTAH